MNVKQQLYELYVGYFEENAASYEKVNRFVSAAGADRLQMKKHDESQVF